MRSCLQLFDFAIFGNREGIVIDDIRRVLQLNLRFIVGLIKRKKRLVAIGMSVFGYHPHRNCMFPLFKKT